MPPELEQKLPRSRFAAIARLRCPECRDGAVYVNRFFKMHQNCPVCRCTYDREPGYFLGAMYFSYAMAIPTIGVITLLLWLFALRTWQPHWVLFPAIVLSLPFLLPIWRYSRVAWMHFDRKFDPE